MCTNCQAHDEVLDVLKSHSEARRDQLIPILQEVQDRIGYLSEDAVVRIGRHLKIPASKIYGVATFYNQFRFQAKGKYHIQVCRGTACHGKGSAAVLEALCRHLKIRPGQTTKDGEFTVETVNCVGACALGPVVIKDGEYHGKMTTDKVGTLTAKKGAKVGRSSSKK